MKQDFLETAVRLRQEHKPFVVATVVDTTGSVPVEMGARMLVVGGSGTEPELIGTIGGGKLEARALQEARQLLAQKPERDAVRQKFFSWRLDSDIGMTCGGSVKVYFELVWEAQNWQIVIFGAGHCAQALCRLLTQIDCLVTVVDTRRQWLDRLPESPAITPVLVSDYGDYVAKLEEAQYVLLMTMGHSTDSPVLVKIMQAMPGRLPYLGVIGSKAKAARLKADLLAAGVEPRYAEAFHCPIGLPFGTNAPGEIAVSVAAQLLSVRDAALKS